MSGEKYVEEFVPFSDTALKDYTHRAAAAAALSRANRFAKVVSHVTKCHSLLRKR